MSFNLLSARDRDRRGGSEATLEDIQKRQGGLLRDWLEGRLCPWAPLAPLLVSEGRDHLGSVAAAPSWTVGSSSMLVRARF